MPNFFEIMDWSYGAPPKLHLTYDDYDYRGGCTVREEDAYISDAGYGLLMAACEAGEIDYTINDACDRFFDEIDILTGDIAEIDKAIEDLTACFMANRIFCSDSEFDKQIRDLRWSKIIKEERKTALEKDLGTILGGYDLPF